MAKAKNTGWAPKAHPKKTSIGQGRCTKFESLGSGNTPPKGYKKKYRGQGKG
tara:strand:- start:53 stop:208 length:156 start_codon:yes stop_codon:yes gene_type:complete